MTKLQNIFKKIYPDKSRIPNPLTFFVAASIDFGWVIIIFLVCREQLMPPAMPAQGANIDLRGFTSQVPGMFLIKLIFDLLMLEAIIWLAVYFDHRRRKR